MQIKNLGVIWATAGLLFFVSAIPSGLAQEFQFELPVPIEADGQVIDTGKSVAHSGPHLTDFDDDGVVDLLVGDFRGNITFYKNTGTNAEHEYAAGKLLEAEGKVIKIHNW